ARTDPVNLPPPRWGRAGVGVPAADETSPPPPPPPPPGGGAGGGARGGGGGRARSRRDITPSQPPPSRGRGQGKRAWCASWVGVKLPYDPDLRRCRRLPGARGGVPRRRPARGRRLYRLERVAPDPPARPVVRRDGAGRRRLR